MTLDDLVNNSHGMAKEKGWWPEGEKRNVGELLMLIVCEVAEACEDVRDGDDGTKISFAQDKQGNPKPIGHAIEIADVFIRLADYCGGLKIPIEEAIKIKLAYNATRPHRHGKVF